MKHEVATLEGALLNDAVALAEGWRKESAPADWPCKATSAWLKDGQMMYCAECQPLEFSDWAHCGPIIERERIGIFPPEMPGESQWFAGLAPCSAHRGATGPTPLIAAMRAYVFAKLGAEVEL
jgi:hypothetical protein